MNSTPVIYQNGSETKKSVTLDNPERLCDARCNVCNSSHSKAIHDLKRKGFTFVDIVKIVKEKLGFETSSAGLSRHFVNYNKRRDALTAEIMQTDLIDESTCRAVHNQELLKLIKLGFSSIKTRIYDGSLRLDISDLEKVMKLYYQVLQGQDTDENDVFAIFQKATDKYGLNLEQGILFKSRRAEQ